MKLKEINKEKYCVNCKEVVTIEIKGVRGICPECETTLFTWDTKMEKNK